MQSLTQRIHLEENEKVIKVLRKHWFILVAKIFGPVVLLIAPYPAFLFARNNSFIMEILGTTEDAGSFVVFLAALWTLLMWSFIWTLWTDYYLDMWTITNRRVIAIDQQGLFRRQISSFRYERLQEVEISINGIIATFLNFGTLQASTAGHDDDVSGFTFEGAPRPRKIKALILKEADKRVTASRAHSASSTVHDDGL